MVDAGYYEGVLGGSGIGYGCSQLMARIGRAESIRLLEAAFDGGITHFDVARSYGYGEAESALGAFLAGRRDQVTVTTKLGLGPPRGSGLLKVAKVAARAAVAAAPPLGRVIGRWAAGAVQPGRFSPLEARASLETSLRELRTDRVDLLLLHECRPTDLSEELLAFLRDAVRDGRVGGFGIATAADASAAILAARPEFAPLVQVANGVTDPTVETTPELWRSAVITHSALAGLDRVHRHVVASGERTRSWSEAIGADCSDRRVLAELMLAWARAANPRGVVLFSSRDPSNIRANAVSSEPTSDRVERAQHLARLVRDELGAQEGRISSSTASPPTSSDSASARSHEASGRTDRTGS